MTWVIVSQLMSYRERDGHVLGVMVATDTLLVTAVETPKPSKHTRKNHEAIAAGIFKNHGHKVVGTFESLSLAMVAAEKFADHWEAGHSIAECPCQEIK